MHASARGFRGLLDPARDARRPEERIERRSSWAWSDPLSSDASRLVCGRRMQGFLIPSSARASGLRMSGGRCS
ncbi:hypothetical protein XHC_0771 [Xanthomonas hortorum pv. carotae str. M081]|nr:hypothetical protein XHC_0771 [Xanthomonas hortorum pv. carotae str. M081]